RGRRSHRRGADATDLFLSGGGLHAPRRIWFFVQLPREASKGRGSLPPHFTNSKHHCGAELSSCTRSPSAVSGQCQRSQRPLASLGASANSRKTPNLE